MLTRRLNASDFCNVGVYYGNLAEVKKMFSENKDLLEEKNQTEFLPLHIAVAEGNLEIVKYLIASGAKIDCKGMYEWSPLHLAVIFNQPDIVKTLLESVHPEIG